MWLILSYFFQKQESTEDCNIGDDNSVETTKKKASSEDQKPVDQAPLSVRTTRSRAAAAAKQKGNN